MKIRWFLMSFMYKKLRSLSIFIYYLMVDLLFLRRDLEHVILFGDKLYEIMNYSFIKPCVVSFKISSNIGYELYDLHFPSPITFASFKAHPATLLCWLEMGIGGGCFKTIKQNPSSGNPRPRIVELKHSFQSGFINALGLPNPGVDVFLSQFNESAFGVFDRPLGFSIGGSSLDEYKYVFSKFNLYFAGVSLKYYYELNLSCPNTSTGLSLGQDLEQLNSLLQFIRSAYAGVLSLKLSPDFSDKHLSDIADLASHFGSVFLNCGNTSFVKLPFYGVPDSSISIKQGGMSGEFLFHRTCEMITLLKSFKLPLMATGGIQSFEDILTLKKCGAGLFGLATSLIHDPYCVVDWNDRLKNM